MAIADVLQRVPFFSHLSAPELDRLAAHGRIAACEPGDYVVREGEIADSMYVILNGDVRVYKTNPDGTKIDIAQLTVGSFFGELALLDEGERSATVRCLTPCGFFILDHPSFLTLITTSDSSVVQRLFAALARRLRDTTERVMQDEIARQAMEANMEIERLRSLSQMVAGVAHEINTPLGIINTAAGMINSRVTMPQIGEALNADPKTRRAYEDMVEASDLITRNIERAARLVQDFKKISVQQLTDVKENVELVELVQSTVDLFKISAKKAKLEIAITETVGENCMWDGYPGYFTQVLLNLMTNIERYAYPQGVGGRIDVGLARGGDSRSPTYVLTVRDYGAGIAPENLPRVFDPFFTTGRSKGGTGLGLAIVYNIVSSALQGDIEMESEVGSGTLVTVTLPQVVPEVAK